jgi:hypothetical protein
MNTAVQPIEGVVENRMPQAVQPRTHAMTTTPAELLAVAVNQGADLEKLEKLMALQERWEANEARKAYVAAMTTFKAEPMRIGKNKHVAFKTSTGKTEYDHAELSDVTDVVVPRLAAHGFSHSWTVCQDSKGITVACVLTHKLGHSERVEMTAPADTSGGKNTIQAIASTKTYLERYTLLASVGMATGGQDDDGRGSEDRADDSEGGDDSEAVISDWITAINECIDAPTLAARRKEMIEKLGAGNIAKVPQRVRQAAVRRSEELSK